MLCPLPNLHVVPAIAPHDRAGVPTVMINSGSVSGVPAHASQPILTDILRTELNFTGEAMGAVPVLIHG